MSISIHDATGERQLRIFLYILLVMVLAAGIHGPANASDHSEVAGPRVVRQGDVVQYSIDREDGAPLSDVLWTVAPESAGLISEDGRFVGYAPGTAVITAFMGTSSVELDVMITPRYRFDSQFDIVGHGRQVDRFNSDLWVQGSVAYTGTWQGRSPATSVRMRGDRMHAWDVSDPGAPQMASTVTVDARTVNDVKINPAGTLAVISQEGSQDGLNGITFLDMEDPLRPVVISRFIDELTTGVHNVWIDGDFVHAVTDGLGLGLRIIDISSVLEPELQQLPFVTARFFGGPSFLHDVIVREGLAFLSHWDDGLIILDVGNGILGGSPQNPVEVSRVPDLDGQTHNAWYWPEAGYVFVGEEDSLTPGIMHVVDVSDLFLPNKVATFAVAGDTPHNFWLDETRGILYAAWYTRGLRAVDVNGELFGELDRQGREVASIIYGSNAGCFTSDGTCTWAPQLHEGLIFLSDLNTGLWVMVPQIDLEP